MAEIKAIIADDEEHLRKYLKSRLLNVWPELTICGEAANGRKALELIREHQPDIAFLDIRMPGLTGMEVAKKTGGSCWIVFITAYDQYAVEAFENEAIDYILKPVTRKRLKKTTDRLKKQIAASTEPPIDFSTVVEKLITSLKDKERPGYLRWIRAQQRDSIRLIPVDEILYFKAGDKYTILITREGESLIRKSIRDLANELDPNRFWRIHRGTIVNAAYIESADRSLTGRPVVRLKDLPGTLTVSRSYAYLFKQM